MTIALVEDHLMFREVLRKVCVEDLGHEVVAEAGDGAQAVAAVSKAAPDLLLLDLHLPNLDGFAVIEQIRKSLPEIKVLVLSSHCDEYTVFRAERARVLGFVDKNTNSVATLRTAISAAAQGKPWFSEPFQRIRLARLRDPRAFDKVLGNRERDVLVLVGQSMTDVEIGAKLGISPETAEKHRFNLMRKLDLKSTAELARYAREHGFTLSTPPRGGDALLP